MILLFQKISAAAGMVWIAGKIIYAYGYYSDGNFIYRFSNILVFLKRH
jgi:hypothetical protein